MTQLPGNRLSCFGVVRKERLIRTLLKKREAYGYLNDTACRPLIRMVWLRIMTVRFFSVASVTEQDVHDERINLCFCLPFLSSCKPSNNLSLKFISPFLRLKCFWKGNYLLVPLFLSPFSTCKLSNSLSFKLVNSQTVFLLKLLPPSYDFNVYEGKLLTCAFFLSSFLHL